MNISVFGLGYVGCVATGCLARLGHHVVGVDAQKTKVDYVGSGRSTIIEKDIDDLMKAQHAAGRIRATLDSAEAVSHTDVSFICVGTPTTSTGHLDLSAVLSVSDAIGRAIKLKRTRHVIALRSTVLPGTSERVAKIVAAASGRVAGVDFAVIPNPEFLREGSSIEDFEHPSFTLVGSNCDWAATTMREVYGKIEAPFILTAPRVAELMKCVCNSYHALKITFANEIGNICQNIGVDALQVMDIFCRDTKLNVSRAYLRPGFAYGGSCLPKDLTALQTIAHDNYLHCPVIESVERSNEHQKEIALHRIERYRCRKIGFVGLSFKPGTDDLRESASVDIIERLLGKGYDVRIYDRHVHVSRLIGANRDYILQRIPFIARFITDDLGTVLAHAELIVVVNDEPGLKAALATTPRGKAIYDLANIGVGREPEATIEAPPPAPSQSMVGTEATARI